jgi:VIT1/CCC1 family predicted Fe2+/Mn2+ transporter
MSQRMLDDEAIEIASDPEHERAELVTLYERRGLTREEASTVADRILADSDAALDTMARDELGIDPEQLGGSPWTAAIASFLLFTVGALPPILPFALADGDLAVALSIVVSSAALLGIGAAITLLTGRGIWRSAFRQLAIGLGAAAVTYGAGFVVGSVV